MKMTCKDNNFQLKYRGRVLSKPEARVLIAKDVIKWIKSGELKINSGYYINNMVSIRRLSGPLKNHLNKVKKCGVCALGACFLSSVDKFNKIDIDALKYNEEQVLRNYLRYIFSPRQMTLIECAFERTQYLRDQLDDKVSNSELREIASNMYNNVGDVNTRLKLIMENIIRNNGRFRLTRPYENKKTKTV